MDIVLPYDPADPKSIEAYAQLLLHKSLRIVLGEGVEQNYIGKGKLGQLLEEKYFLYKPNSTSGPDFAAAGVELKTTPLKQIGKGLVSKERLVYNIINFEEEYKETFKTSSFWRKNAQILLMFYLYEKEKLDIDYIFKIIRLWRFPETDLKIIRDDWEKIVSKIRAGKAHEISEGDTLYLGACTKGANKESLRKQPFSEALAMQRAFSLKSKYLNFIAESSLANKTFVIDEKEYARILDEDYYVVEESPGYYAKRYLENVEPVVKRLAEYKKGQTFEELVLAKFEKYYGDSISEIEEKLGLPTLSGKGKLYDLSKAILGVTKGKIEEFEKADVQMKTIRFEQKGTLKESMSFAQIQYKDIIKEEWEDSYWFEMLTKRFFFVVFQKDVQDDLRLQKVMFWTMPAKDLEVAREFWEDTKSKIEKGDFSHFYKMGDKRICHVRPKGADSHDLMETASGMLEKKKCYWLNASYIKDVITKQ